VSSGPRSARTGRGDPKSFPVKRAESYGGVVVRDAGGVIQVAMIRTRNLKDEPVWTLPKGMREEGESPEDAALREVREETGLDAEIVRALEPVTYWFVSTKDRARYRKTVYLYLMRSTGGDLSRHDGEVDEARFVPIAEARRLATYSTDRKTLGTVADAVTAP
jgi:ADP-ribose pyrophosphatase YjhB (NUDIX family)